MSRITLRQLDSAIEGHLLLGLLRQQGLEAWLLGEHLLGGVGELPACGLLRLVVDEADRAGAEAVLQDWDAATPLPDESQPDVSHGQGLRPA
ncbi:putative signal transducing protein [Roseateles cavernae]|uniref:putative signal transducing protein n=1 Tax=Roseateles cavernae TaxID=3153578 RepID=UPI0032E47913